MINLLWFVHLTATAEVLTVGRETGVPVEVSAVVEQVYRRARAQDGDSGGEMLPIRLLEDLTKTQLHIAAPQE
jgi:3-hydroxyisobutyrate dehydrogenase